MLLHDEVLRPPRRRSVAWLVILAVGLGGCGALERSPSAELTVRLGHPARPLPEVVTGASWRIQTPRCRSAQLRLASGIRVSEQTEQRTRSLILRNVSAKRCELQGYPSIALLDSRGRVLAFRYRRHGDQMLTNAGPGMVPLAPGASAYFAINKTPCEAFSNQIAARIGVTPQGNSTALSVATGRYPILDYCRPPDAGGIIDVTPIEPTAEAVFAPT